MVLHLSILFTALFLQLLFLKRLEKKTQNHWMENVQTCSYEASVLDFLILILCSSPVPAQRWSNISGCLFLSSHNRQSWLHMVLVGLVPVLKLAGI